jgi:hypothetical protein
MDPFVAPNTNTTGGLPYSGVVQSYPDGYNRPIQSFDFMRMLRAPFQSPNWVMNLVWMFVCQIAGIIVVGSLVLIGYQAEVAEARSGGRRENWPDFNPDRFTEYLMRGLWPFLWSLIWTIPLMFVIGVPVIVTFMLSSVLIQSGNDVSGLIVIVTGSLVSMAAYCFAMLVMAASMMHSTLGNDFAKGADFVWIRSYVSKMGVTTIWTGIVYILVGNIMGWLGILCFCVGVLAVGPILNLMAADLLSQLHDIFVFRGGVSAFGADQAETDIIEAQVIL